MSDDSPDSENEVPYQDLVGEVLERTQASAVLLLVIRGSHGNLASGQQFTDQQFAAYMLRSAQRIRSEVPA